MLNSVIYTWEGYIKKKPLRLSGRFFASLSHFVFVRLLVYIASSLKAFSIRLFAVPFIIELKRLLARVSKSSV